MNSKDNKTSQQSGTLLVLQSYAKLGWAPFLGEIGINEKNGKKRVQPFGSWPEMSTSDPKLLEERFEQFKSRRFKRGATMVCLDMTKSGLCAIDTDEKDDGETNLMLLELEYGPLPKNHLRLKTRGGGKHRYFTDKLGLLRNSKSEIPFGDGTIALGVDTRGVGGMTIVSPTKVTVPLDSDWASAEGKYEWDREYHQEVFGVSRINEVDLSKVADISEVPWIIELLGPPGSGTDRRRSPKESYTKREVPPPEFPAAYTAEELRVALFLLPVEEFKDYDPWNELQRAISHSSTCHDWQAAAEVFADWSMQDQDFAGDRAAIVYQFKCNAVRRNMPGGNKVGTFNYILKNHGFGDSDKLRFPPQKAVVRLFAHKWPEITRRVQMLLVGFSKQEFAQPADQVFQRPGSAQLVHLSRNRLSSADAEKGQDKRYHVENDLMVVAVERGWFQDRLERDITFERFGKMKGASGQSEEMWLPCACPKTLVERLEAIRQDWPYPMLRGTVEAPTIRPDGTLLDKPGYDEASGLYYDPGLATFPTIPEAPTREQALAALAVLKQPLADFPFGDDDGQNGVSMSVALALMLTAVCRRSLPICPMFGIDANLAQSGKTELGQVAAIMMTGRRSAVRTWPRDEYQRSAALAAAYEAGDAVIHYDNINGDTSSVEGDAMCAAITEPSIKVRRFGSNSGKDEIRALTNALLIGNGNKLTFAGDMTEGRSLVCYLRPDKDLKDRKFQHRPLDRYVMSIRAELVAAALTILRAGIVRKDMKRVGGEYRFQMWREWVADTLVWLGEADPILSTARSVANDPVRDGQAAVIRAWRQFFGADFDKLRTTVEVLEHADMKQAICDAKGWALNRVNTKNAGQFLKGMVGVKLLGYELKTERDGHDKMQRWWLAAVPGHEQFTAEPVKPPEFDDFEA
jgi:hypothetical protein